MAMKHLRTTHYASRLLNLVPVIQFMTPVLTNVLPLTIPSGLRLAQPQIYGEIRKQMKVWRNITKYAF